MVNSLTCAKVKQLNQIKLPLSVTTTSSVQGDGQTIAASAEAVNGLGMLTQNNTELTGLNRNPESISEHHEAKPASATVKMEVLDDLFGSYGWDESASAVAAAVSAAATVVNNPFSSLLSQVTPLTPPVAITATTKGTVKVPMATDGGTEGVDTTFSPPPPLPTISLASSLTTDSLRVIIPSPHPGPDTTTTMGGSPVANHTTPTTPAAPTTPSSVASSSSTSSKKTVFTAKGM